MLLSAALLAVAVALVPLGYLVLRTAQAGWGEVRAEVFTARVAELAGRSLALAAVVTVACVVVGVGAAFLTTRTDLPARRLFAVLAALPLAVPTYLAAFTWRSTVEGFAGFWAAALVLVLCSYPYVYLPVAAALVGADPAQEEVSASLGRGPWPTFARVTLRQVRPAVAGGALLVALYVLSDFGAVSVLRTDTFTRAVYVTFELGFDRVGALVLSCVLVALTMVVLGAESAVRSRGARYARLGTGVRRAHSTVRLGAARWPTLALLSGLAGLALGVPAASLARRLSEGVSRPGSVGDVATAAVNTFGVSLAGAALTAALALPIGLLVARVPGRLSRFVERLSYLTHALPGVVIGLSLVFFGVNVVYPLYQSVWLLALAYAALFLPLAVAGTAAACAQAPPVLDEVAASLGRRPGAVLGGVTLRLALPGVAAGALLVFLTCTKELPATLLLRPTGTDTLATELWTQTTVAAYAAATPYAVALLLLAAVPTWLLTRRTGVLDRAEHLPRPRARPGSNPYPAATPGGPP